MNPGVYGNIENWVLMLCAEMYIATVSYLLMTSLINSRNH
jgi:hypothetical protein